MKSTESNPVECEPLFWCFITYIHPQSTRFDVIWICHCWRWVQTQEANSAQFERNTLYSRVWFFFFVWSVSNFIVLLFDPPPHWRRSMTADLVSVASLIVMFVMMCSVIKMYLAVMNMQPRDDHSAVMGMQPRAVTNAEQNGYRTTRNYRGRKRQTAQRVGNRPRPQEHDERFYWASKRHVKNVLF